MNTSLFNQAKAYHAFFVFISICALLVVVLFAAQPSIAYAQTEPYCTAGTEQDYSDRYCSWNSGIAEWECKTSYIGCVVERYTCGTSSCSVEVNYYCLVQNNGQDCYTESETRTASCTNDCDEAEPDPEPEDPTPPPPDDPDSQTLRVFKNGTGTGTVTSSPSGINCGSTCAVTSESTRQWTLSASPSSTSTFTTWSEKLDTYNTTCGARHWWGGCKWWNTANTCGTLSQCRVTVASGGTKNITATFASIVPVLEQYRLTTLVSPSGAGTISPSSRDYDAGTNVNVTRTVNPGYVFSGWSGACGGTGTCTVAMTSDKTVTANFNSEPLPLSVSLKANRIQITRGESSKLTWSSANADSCTATNFTLVGSPFNDSTNVFPTTNTTYYFECENAGGSIERNVSVAVQEPAISELNVWVDPTWVSRGESTDVRWDIKPDGAGDTATCTVVSSDAGVTLSPTGDLVYSNDEYIVEASNIQQVTQFTVSCSNRTTNNINGSAIVYVLPTYSEF